MSGINWRYIANLASDFSDREISLFSFVVHCLSKQIIDPFTMSHSQQASRGSRVVFGIV